MSDNKTPKSLKSRHKQSQNKQHSGGKVAPKGKKMNLEDTSLSNTGKLMNERIGIAENLIDREPVMADHDKVLVTNVNNTHVTQSKNLNGINANVGKESESTQMTNSDKEDILKAIATLNVDISSKIDTAVPDLESRIRTEMKVIRVICQGSE